MEAIRRFIDQKKAEVSRIAGMNSGALARKQLADIMDLDPSTISRLLQKVEGYMKKGVTRQARHTIPEPIAHKVIEEYFIP
jgi:hypothetical protein